MNQKKTQSKEHNSVLEQRRKKAQNLEKDGFDLFPNTFRKDIDIIELINNYGSFSSEELLQIEQNFSLAGRIMSLRSFGKAAFINLQDQSEKMQIFVQRDVVGQEQYNFFKKFDIGDIVGVQGYLFRTKTGELSLNAKFVTLVTKSMRPLPEKYHGLKDVEIRYRQRYVDLIVNPKAREVFKTRAHIVKLVRQFLEDYGFIEVETPMMQPIPGGATAKPFETYHNALDMNLYLRVAPELYLKRLLVGGLEKVYEINRNFRNEGVSTQHNPEFTMLEFYWAYNDFYGLMNFTEEMFSYLANKISSQPQIYYQDQFIDLSPPWERLTFYQALEEIGKLQPHEYQDRENAKHLVKSLGENVQVGEKLGKMQTKLFDILVEPHLIQPHFIYHYPTDVSPLSRKNQENPEVTDRFELFIAGRELANAFSELNDPRDQKARFEEQVQAKEQGDEESLFMDTDYIRALEYGMPPAAGEGIGIDRLVMIFTNSASIREVILFPHLKPEAY